jgi:hypothetical protein
MSVPLFSQQCSTNVWVCSTAHGMWYRALHTACDIGHCTRPCDTRHCTWHVIQGTAHGMWYRALHTRAGQRVFAAEQYDVLPEVKQDLDGHLWTMARTVVIRWLITHDADWYQQGTGISFRSAVVQTVKGSSVITCELSFNFFSDRTAARVTFFQFM